MRLGKLTLAFVAFTTAFAATDVRVGSVPKDIRAEFRLSSFYTKYVDIGGVPIVASDKVSDFALLEARFLVEQTIGNRPDVLAAIAKSKVRLAIMSPQEMTTDIPEHSDLTPKDHWDVRARGLGATEARPAVSCGEENLLGYVGDPYSAENILIHEFAHTIHERGLNTVDPTFDGRLRAAFEAAQREGLWKGTYAGSNRMEYWAEGTQSWFDTNRENDSEHNAISTRAKLKTYDRRLAALLTEVFGDREWRYALPAKRSPPSAHLAGFDLANAPHFAWPERLAKARGGPAVASQAPAALPAAGSGPLSLAPTARPSWKSVGGGKATKIIFQNAAASTVQLDWMDFEGRPKTYFTLRKGEQTEAGTYRRPHLARSRRTRNRARLLRRRRSARHRRREVGFSIGATVCPRVAGGTPSGRAQRSRPTSNELSPTGRRWMIHPADIAGAGRSGGGGGAVPDRDRLFQGQTSAFFDFMQKLARAANQAVQ